MYESKVQYHLRRCRVMRQCVDRDEPLVQLRYRFSDISHELEAYIAHRAVIRKERIQWAARKLLKIYRVNRRIRKENNAVLSIEVG